MKSRIVADVVPSVLRDFSAPVVLEYGYTDAELLHLFKHDSDPVNRWEAGQRLAMTRLLTLTRAVQDGTELTPTYDWPAERLVFAMAGGMEALVKSSEGAEDNEAAGAQAMADAKIGANDVVIGIAASGTTPYTIGALRAATAAGGWTSLVDGLNRPL